MSQLVLHANNIDEITQAELLSLLILRTSVFIVEQNCPYQDADGFDHQAIHIWFEDENGIAACTRALPPHTRFEEASIGRIITAPEYRGKGLGLKIVKAPLRKQGKGLTQTGSGLKRRRMPSPCMKKPVLKSALNLFLKTASNMLK